jgi:probable F420-dependent oxidoreductase
MARPFRFSLQVATTGSRTEWRDRARQAADLGFSLLVTADHLDEVISPLVSLVSAADAAPGLRVGTMVLNNDLRHPSLLAREAAAVDLLTDGRLEVGIGAGHAQPEYERNGIPFDPPGTRVNRLSESVQVLRRLLDGETVSFHGRYYDIKGETAYPKPAQSHVPLLVGGGGNRTLAVAAQWADAVGFTGLGRTLADGSSHELTGFSPAAVTRQVEWVRTTAGSRADDLEFQALVQAVIVTDRPHTAAEDLVGPLRPLSPSHPLSPDEILASPYLLIGTVGGIVESLLERRERWGFSHYTIRTAALSQFGPVVVALAGR